MFWCNVALPAPRLVVAGVILGAALAVPSAVAQGPPSFDWAVSGGGLGSDDADGIGIDPFGRPVISGGFDGTSSFDAGHSLTSAGGTDVFAAGYNKRGRVRWVKRFGGAGPDQAFDSDVDSKADAVLTGSFNRTVDFGTGPLTSRGGTLPRYGDAFLVKLGALGRTKWVRQIGGTGSDGGDEVAIGRQNRIYVIGDSDGDTNFGSGTVVPNTGGRDSWAANFSRTGRLRWARSLGGPGTQQAHGISSDPKGHALVTGEFQGTSVFGSHRLDSAGAQPDVYLAKLGRTGGVLWAQRLGGAARDIGRGVDADAKGHIYVSGEFAGTIQLGSTTLTSVGGDDSFVAKLTPRGRVLWATRLGLPGNEIGPEIEVDGSGNSYLTGSSIVNGARAAWVTKLGPRGKVRWTVGSSASPFATLGELALGPGTVGVLGRYAGQVTLGRFSLQGAGQTDFFLAQLPRDGSAAARKRR